MKKRQRMKNLRKLLKLKKVMLFLGLTVFLGCSPEIIQEKSIQKERGFYFEQLEEIAWQLDEYPLVVDSIKLILFFKSGNEGTFNIAIKD